MAAETGALKGLRKDKSADNLLRTLLIHLGCGRSLRETAARARAAGLADLSNVALPKRLRRLCVELFRENGVSAEGAGTGETLLRFPVERDDRMLADRGYSSASGLRHVADCGGHATVRVNTGALRLRGADGKPFDLRGAVSSLKRAGDVGSWSTLEYAKYVIVFTTFPESEFDATAVLRGYRLR